MKRQAEEALDDAGSSEARSRDKLQRRFQTAQSLLGILMGVLGVVMGFYSGDERPAEGPLPEKLAALSSSLQGITDLAKAIEAARPM